MKLILISCSLNSHSHSTAMARYALEILKNSDHKIEHVDLANWDLPHCDGHSCYNNEQVIKLTHKIEKASGIIISTPIYNFDVNAVAKNLLELTGKAWTEKVVGFICSAGGNSSYMSVMPFANSLMLDFRCLIIPRFVYATSDAFRENEIHDTELNRRIKELTDVLLRYTSALDVNMQTA